MHLVAIVHGQLKAIDTSGEQTLDELLRCCKAINYALSAEWVCAIDLAATFLDALGENEFDIAHAAAGEWSILAERHRVEDLAARIKTHAESHAFALGKDGIFLTNEVLNETDTVRCDQSSVAKLRKESLRYIHLQVVEAEKFLLAALRCRRWVIVRHRRLFHVHCAASRLPRLIHIAVISHYFLALWRDIIFSDVHSSVLEQVINSLWRQLVHLIVFQCFNLELWLRLHVIIWALVLPDFRQTE